MGRKGVSVTLIVTLMFAAFVLMQVMSGLYEGLATSQVHGQVFDTMRENVAGELVMSADCATASRGVFYRSAVISGDFGCVIPESSIYVSFKLDDATYRWDISRSGDAARIVESPESRTYQQTYSVQVYDEAENKYQRAVMKVGFK